MKRIGVAVFVVFGLVAKGLASPGPSEGPISDGTLVAYVGCTARIRAGLEEERARIEEVVAESRAALRNLRRATAARQEALRKEACAAAGVPEASRDALEDLVAEYVSIRSRLGKPTEEARAREALQAFDRRLGASAPAWARVAPQLEAGALAAEAARTALEHALVDAGARPFDPPRDGTPEDIAAYVARHLDVVFASCPDAKVEGPTAARLVRLTLAAECKALHAPRRILDVRVEPTGGGEGTFLAVEAVELTMGGLVVSGPLLRGPLGAEGIDSAGWHLSRACVARGSMPNVRIDGAIAECRPVRPTKAPSSLELCARSRLVGAGGTVGAIAEGIDAMSVTLQAAIVLGRSDTVAFDALCAGHGVTLDCPTCSPR